MSDWMDQVFDHFEAAWQRWREGQPWPRKEACVPVNCPPEVRGNLLSELADMERDLQPVWYYAPTNHVQDRVGPVSRCQLRALAVSGKLKPHYLVRDPDEGRWMNAPRCLPNVYEVGGHLLEDTVGKGGMGIVYRARDISLDTVRALKMILETINSEEASWAFHMEAKTVAKLQHPHIVQVHKFGEHEEQPYLSMEFVDGSSLDRNGDCRLPILKPLSIPGIAAFLLRPLQRWPGFAGFAAKMVACGQGAIDFLLPPLKPRPAQEENGQTWSASQVKERLDRLVDLMVAVANAIQYAHGRGVIHRDLKPHNVLLTREGTPKVADFGLAHAAGPAGTPGYMSPEQTETDSNEKVVGTAADVYGLGAILYEQLTSRPPFQGPDRNEVIRQVSSPDPPVRPGLLNPAVPRNLEAICLKCLKKDPNERYPSARAFAEDLTRFKTNQPIKARRVRPLERARLWKIRYPWITRLATVCALLIMISFYFYWQRRIAERETRLEELKGHYANASLKLRELRQIKEGRTGPDTVAQVRSLAKDFSRLRKDFDAGARVWGEPAQLMGDPWEQLGQEVRDEVTPWLTNLRLTQGRHILLPDNLDTRAPLAVAIRSEDDAVAEIAVLAAGSRKALVLAPDGKERQQLAVPDLLVRMARTESSSVRRRSLNAIQSNTDTDFAPFRLEYQRPDRLTYQVKQQYVTWDPSTGKSTESGTLPDHVFPQPWAGRMHDFCPRYTASVDDRGVTVKVTPWGAEARPVVRWRAAGGDPAEGGETIGDIVFGTRGQALFILTNKRLAVVDVDTGASVEAMLPEVFSLGARTLVPCAGGATLVERKGSGPAQLTFWQVTLPPVCTHTLRHDAPVRWVSVDGEKDRRLVIAGTADHILRGWRGFHPVHDWGIPDLGLENPSSGNRPRDAGASRREGATVVRQTRQSSSAGDPAARRHVTNEYVWGLRPYQNWAFLPGQGNRFLVQRVVQKEGESPLPITEVYAISQDGGLKRPALTYPAEGPGRLLAIDPHGRLAVRVAAEDEARVTLQLVSLADGTSLGEVGSIERRVGNPRTPAISPVAVSFVAGLTRSDYLLVAKQTANGGESELNIWDVKDRPRWVNSVLQPNLFAAAFTIDTRERAIVWRTRLTATGPYFAEVIDLAKGTAVPLQEFETIGNLSHSLYTADHYVALCHQGLGNDLNDPYRAFVWDLRTGRRQVLDRTLWSSATLPDIELSPDGRHLVICGNLHQTGEACARLYDLEEAAPVGQPCLRPWPARPRLPALADTHCLVAFDNYPSTGEAQAVRIRWEDGEESPQTGGPELVSAQRYYSGLTGWLLWQAHDGLLLQDGYGGERLPVKQTEALAGHLQWLMSGRTVIWPSSNGQGLVLLGPGGGIWRRNRRARCWERMVEFPPGQRFLGFDAAQRWALTSDPEMEKVWLWDGLRGKKVWQGKLPFSVAPPSVDVRENPWRLSPDGRHLAVVSQGLLQVLDIKDNRVRGMIPKAGHCGPVTCVAQHAGRNLVVSGDGEGLVFLWRRSGDQSPTPLIAHSATVTALAFQPDGAAFASSGLDGTIALWDLAGRNRWRYQIEPATTVTRLAFLSKSRLLAGTGDGRVVFLHAETGKLLTTRQCKPGPIHALAVSQDGAMAAGTDRGVYLWPGKDKQPLRWAKGSPVKAVAFIPGSRLLATAGQQVQLWDTEMGRPVWKLEVPRGPVQAMAMDSATGELAVVDQSTDVTIFHLADLHHQLEELDLGIPAFPRSKWPLLPGPKPAHAPQVDDWVQRAEEHLRRREWSQLSWASTTALRKWPTDPRLWFYLGEAASRDLQSWDVAKRAYINALTYSGARIPKGSTGDVYHDLARLQHKAAQEIHQRRP